MAELTRLETEKDPDSIAATRDIQQKGTLAQRKREGGEKQVSTNRKDVSCYGAALLARRLTLVQLRQHDKALDKRLRNLIFSNLSKQQLAWTVRIKTGNPSLNKR